MPNDCEGEKIFVDDLFGHCGVHEALSVVGQDVVVEVFPDVGKISRTPLSQVRQVVKVIQHG